jgi:hypothetical protein
MVPEARITILEYSRDILLFMPILEAFLCPSNQEEHKSWSERIGS